MLPTYFQNLKMKLFLSFFPVVTCSFKLRNAIKQTSKRFILCKIGREPKCIVLYMCLVKPNPDIRIIDMKIQNKNA